MSDLKFLIAKLNPVCRTAAEAAATEAVARGHREVDVTHLLYGLVRAKCPDLRAAFSICGVDAATVASELTAALGRSGHGSVSRTPLFSDDLIRLLQSAWNRSVEFQFPAIRSGTILLATGDPEQKKFLSGELAKLDIPRLRGNLPALFTQDEGGFNGTAAEPEATESMLAQYTVDLTAAARAGALDPVIGRDAEIRQIAEILARRRQNNPILTGDPGVGKTAVVEGFALRVAAGDVAPSLRPVSVRTLDLGLLTAGASVRGEFENRLKRLMREVQSSAQPVILFIDEAHTLVGGDTGAADLLKPALARGELRMIAATTYLEYRKYFESDPALARRFQMVAVDQPNESEAVQMLRALVPQMERHHGVRILGEAVRASVELSHRYVAGRQLPDKAIGVLDTACARVALAQNATPSAIDDCRCDITSLEGEIAEVERERLTGAAVDATLQGLFERLGLLEMQLANLEDRCNEERQLVGCILELRGKLESSGGENELVRTQLLTATETLGSLQGDNPLVPAFVDARVVGEVISEATGIPLRRTLGSEVKTVLGLRAQLQERIAGQTDAIDAIAKRVVSARAGLEDPRRPAGVFLFAGPSGVGKTETAMALADILFGGERNAVVLNMSEYQEGHSISGLKGSPPGYVGYGEGGVLTEAVRRRPYCLVLLDEMEKAHIDVLELFYQVFDKGMLEDAQGRLVDFRNTIIIATSNVGTDVVQRMCMRLTMPTPAELEQAMGAELRSVFQPALLGRMTVVPFYPITAPVRRQITEMKLAAVQRRLQSIHGVSLAFTPDLVDCIAERCADPHSGARNIDHLLSDSIIPELSQRILYAAASRDSVSQLLIDVDEAGEFRYQAS